VADQLPFPVRVVGEEPPAAARPAPGPGEHAEEILRDVLGYDTDRVDLLRESGALGPPQ
jgi:crotonobetainyl-CoA:carnitine CoA-transferase CaiB-like acyl-CoA transferase